MVLKVVGRSGKIVKEVASQVDKSIRVVERSQDDLETIKRTTKPRRVESVNTVFTPEGQSKKIVVSDEYQGKINITEGEFEEVINPTGTPLPACLRITFSFSLVVQLLI